MKWQGVTEKLSREFRSSYVLFVFVALASYTALTFIESFPICTVVLLTISHTTKLNMRSMFMQVRSSMLMCKIALELRVCYKTKNIHIALSTCGYHGNHDK